VHDREAEVEVRGKRLRVKIDELRVIGGAPPRQTVSVNVSLQPRDALVVELNLIGCTVDEAVTRAERFLDEAALTDQQNLRIIHGFGTGQLRRAISEFLKQHVQVASFGPAPDGQGGGGVTLVEMKD
jgi:DNA mismatch repair protein MutS2